jgi:hypothetical protein
MVSFNLFSISFAMELHMVYIATHANGKKVATCSREMAILSQKDKKTTLK